MSNIAILSVDSIVFSETEKNITRFTIKSNCLNPIICVVVSSNLTAFQVSPRFSVISPFESQEIRVDSIRPTHIDFHHDNFRVSLLEVFPEAAAVLNMDERIPDQTTIRGMWTLALEQPHSRAIDMRVAVRKSGRSSVLYGAFEKDTADVRDLTALVNNLTEQRMKNSVTIAALERKLDVLAAQTARSSKELQNLKEEYASVKTSSGESLIERVSVSRRSLLFLCVMFSLSFVAGIYIL